jgi:AcrR family transcriptional regulator
LLEAAAAVVAARGYHRATVDEIAEAAGYTKGAVYSNFTNKEEILLSLLEDLARAWCAAIADAYAVEGDVQTRLRKGGETLTVLTERESSWFLLLAEVWSESARNPKLRRRLAAMYQEARTKATDHLTRQLAELEFEPLLPPADIAALFIALTDGFVLQKLVDPGRFRRGFLADGMGAFLASVMRPAGRPE